MTLATNKNQILLIYSNQSSIGNQVLGYVKSTDIDHLLRSLEETPITGTQWTQIAEKMDVDVESLFDKSVLSDDQETSNLDTDGWIKMIDNNPELLQNPILIQGNRIEQITTPSQGMSFIQVDSAGLEKQPLGEELTTETQTKNETQVP